MKSHKEIRVFCDFETNTMAVRIFKYRNYTWSGGRLESYEVKRDSYVARELGRIVQKYRDEVSENKVWSDRDLLWNGENVKAVGYNVWIGDKDSKPKRDGAYYLGRD